MPATFDFIDNRFFDQKIKVQKVIYQNCGVQEFGDLLVPGASATFTITFNTATQQLNLAGVGDVTLSLALAPGLAPTLQSATVLPNKIVNNIIVPVNLRATSIATGVVTTVDGIFSIPVQGMLDVPGAAPGDTVQKHDVQIEGLPVSFFFVPGSTTAVTLVLKAILEMCVIVSSERVLKVNAAEEFC